MKDKQGKQKRPERKSRTSLFEGNSDYLDIKLDLQDAHNSSSSDTFEEIMQKFKKNNNLRKLKIEETLHEPVKMELLSPYKDLRADPEHLKKKKDGQRKSFLQNKNTWNFQSRTSNLNSSSRVKSNRIPTKNHSKGSFIKNK